MARGNVARISEGIATRRDHVALRQRHSLHDLAASVNRACDRWLRARGIETGAPLSQIISNGIRQHQATKARQKQARRDRADTAARDIEASWEE